MKSSLKPDFNLPACGEDELCQDTVKLTRPCRFYLVLFACDRLGEGLPSLHPLTPTGSQLLFSDQRFSSGGEFECFHARIVQGVLENTPSFGLVHFDQTGRCCAHWNHLTIY